MALADHTTQHIRAGEELDLRVDASLTDLIDVEHALRPLVEADHGVDARILDEDLDAGLVLVG